MWCPSYATLRESIDIDDDLDMVCYFQSVTKLREALKKDEYLKPWLRYSSALKRRTCLSSGECEWVGNAVPGQKGFNNQNFLMYVFYKWNK